MKTFVRILLNLECVSQMDYKYSMLGTEMDYGQKPQLLQVDDMPMNLFAVLKVKQQLRKHLSAASCFRKITPYGFVIGLVLVFLTIASYILTGDKKDLLITPSPYRFNNLPIPRPLAFNLSLLKDDEQIKLIIKSITSKVEFHSTRKIPDFKALAQSEPHMFSAIPRKFLPLVKTPCWYEEYTGNIKSNPYRNNMFEFNGRRFEKARLNFWKHLIHQDGKLYRMRCLPYFYIIGQPKCGTTDLYNRLRLHPDVRFAIFKEPHWWTRRKFGLKSLQQPYPVEDYLDLFDPAIYHILGNHTTSTSGLPSQPNIVIGEASASTMWDSRAWVYYYGNHTEEDPPFLAQDFIHALHPQTRFIVTLRDPVERLYSDYLYFGSYNKSAEEFHEKVLESLLLLDGCLAEYTARFCVYKFTVTTALPVRLHIGLYILFLMDWLSVVSAEQILVLRLEDQAFNRKYTMQKIFDFLNLRPPTEEIESKIMGSPVSNTRKAAAKSLGPMLQHTKEILQEFYRPFNKLLAEMLQNDSFLWEETL